MWFVSKPFYHIRSKMRDLRVRAKKIIDLGLVYILEALDCSLLLCVCGVPTV